MAKEPKKKKEKIIYIDDGSTIADMSATKPSAVKQTGKYTSPHRSSFKERWRTYWDAVKLMFLPMLVVMGLICVLFLIFYFIF